MYSWEMLIVHWWISR